MALRWKPIFATAAFVLICCTFSHSQAKSSDPWAAWQFLVGRWSTVGGGAPGQGAGSTSFAFDLSRRVLVRKNHVDYPATKERPAFAHDDLLITYKDPTSDRVLADYWDNEGHVIHYSAAVLGNDSIQLVSLPASGPAFRLTYIKISIDEIKIRFEIAPADKPGNFKVYAEGTAQRDARSSVPLAPQVEIEL